MSEKEYVNINLIEKNSLDLSDIVAIPESIGLKNIKRVDLDEFCNVLGFKFDTTHANIGMKIQEKIDYLSNVADLKGGLHIYGNVMGCVINNLLIENDLMSIRCREAYSSSSSYKEREEKINKIFKNEKIEFLKDLLAKFILSLKKIDREFFLSEVNKKLLSTVSDKKCSLYNSLKKSMDTLSFDGELMDERFKHGCIILSGFSNINVEYLKVEVLINIVSAFAMANKTDPSILKNYKAITYGNVYKDKESLFAEARDGLFSLVKRYCENGLNKEHPLYEKQLDNVNKFENSLLGLFKKDMLSGKLSKDFYKDSYSERNYFRNFSKSFGGSEKIAENLKQVLIERLEKDDYKVDDFLYIWSNNFLRKSAFYLKNILPGLSDKLVKTKEVEVNGESVIDIVVNTPALIKLELLSANSFEINGKSLISHIAGFDGKYSGSNEKETNDNEFFHLIWGRQTILKQQEKAEQMDSDLLRLETQKRFIEIEKKIVKVEAQILNKIVSFRSFNNMVKPLGVELLFNPESKEYLIRTNDRKKAIFLSATLKTFLTVAPSMESEVESIVDSFLMKEDVGNVQSITKQKSVRKF